STGPLADVNPYRFSSKEYDPKTGLYYFGGRFYESNFQRFSNQDPIGEAGGINLYQFVGNDPVNNVDPFGFFDSWPTGGIHNEIIDEALARQFSTFRLGRIKAGSFEVDTRDYGAYLTGLPYDVGSHFDDISTSLQLGANWLTVWQQMDDLAKRSAEAFAKCGNGAKYIPLLAEYGGILHAVQDFYAHSDFVNKFSGVFDPTNPAHWSTRTGFTASTTATTPFELRHGEHHGSALGMHKDHPGRPDFAAARASAVDATAQNWDIMGFQTSRRPICESATIPPVVYRKEAKMNLINRSTVFGLILALAAVNLSDVGGVGASESELKSYTLTKRAVLYDGSPVFKVEEGKIDDDFVGPALFHGKILIVCGVRNRVLVFAEKGKLYKDIKVPVKTPRMFYPNRTLIGVVVNLGKNVLILNTEGKAYFFTESLRLKRMRSLDIDVDTVGGPHKCHYSPYTDTFLQIPCSRKLPDDYEVIINLRSMKIEYQGIRRKGAKS
ncbi:MAG: repeat protein, partial [Bacteroidetes bacterium]|nr:repeat protein [Bacteroidota bacterium]